MPATPLHPLLKTRLDSEIDILKSGCDAAAGHPSAVQGAERELLVIDVFRRIVPPSLRVGSGTIIDEDGNSTGQVDIVIEQESYSFSLLDLSPRLFLAAGVVAAIEVKSNIADSKSWKAVKQKGEEIATLKRGGSPETPLPEKSELEYRLPFVGFGFLGWSKADTYKRKLEEVPSLDAIFSVDPPRMALRHGGKVRYGAGAKALFALLLVLRQWQQHVDHNLFKYLGGLEPLG